MTLRFGTDGVRGEALTELTPELVHALGRAAALTLDADRFVVGRDTRESGPVLEDALTEGMRAEGADVERLEVVPTPVVAWVAARENIAGAVLSASHNPYRDNGVKLFAPGGRKLTDDVERRLEAALDRLRDDDAPPGGGNGAMEDRSDVAGHYLEWVTSTVPANALDGLRIVVDCANGAAYRLAPAALRRLGADVEVLGADPNGTNINDRCGSTHPDRLQERVGEIDAAAGLAFDGDADRVLAVDEQGDVVDGDHIIALCAGDRHDRGALPDDTVVVTVMTNLGFRLAMEERGIRVVETPVGDRHVLEALEKGGWGLGGEQSGHIVFRDLATTGDGLLTGIQLLDLVGRSGERLSRLASAAMTRLPQVLHNVEVAERAPDVAERLAAEIEAVEGELGETGRVLVRPSGTEPLVRVMVEAPTEEQADRAAQRLVDAVKHLDR